MDSEGEGEGGIIRENGIETCILSCKKRIASLGLMQDTGCLGLVHWDDPEGCYGEGGGRGVQEWELTYTHMNVCTHTHNVVFHEILLDCNSVRDKHLIFLTK